MKQYLLIALLAVAPVRGAHAADRFEPGLWRSTSFVAGRQAETKGPRCVTAKEARSMNGSADSVRIGLEDDPAWRGCKIRDVRVEGASVAFTAACASEVVTTSETTYAGSSYAGTISVALAGSPVLDMTIKGERAGPCP
jgi:hypothetical protein